MGFFSYAQRKYAENRYAGGLDSSSLISVGTAPGAGIGSGLGFRPSIGIGPEPLLASAFGAGVAAGLTIATPPAEADAFGAGTAATLTIAPHPAQAGGTAVGFKPGVSGGTVTTIQGGFGAGAGLDFNGILCYLAGQTSSSGNNYGPDLAANVEWPAINGHGALPATPVSLGLVGALNYKAGTTGYDLNLVCNVIAGTENLEADLALRVYAGVP